MKRVGCWLSLVVAACFSEGDVDPSGGSGSASAESSASAEMTGLTGVETGASESSADASVTSSDPDTTTATECGPLLPVPPFEAPWAGPILIAQGEPMAPPPQCPDGFSRVGEPVVGESAPNQCGCTCAEPVQERCTVQVQQGMDTQCGGRSVYASDACTLLGPGTTHARATVSPGLCTPVAVPGAGAGPMVMCGPNIPEGSCIDVAAETQGPCIYAEGDEACPPEYPVSEAAKRIECTACTECESVAEYCDAIELVTWSEMNCTGEMVEPLIPTQCNSSAGDAMPMISLSMALPPVFTCTTSVSSETALSICCAG